MNEIALSIVYDIRNTFQKISVLLIKKPNITLENKHQNVIENELN